ncbi:MAG: N-acyl-D-amino-acid deacylase [Myxococcota bacterium]|jgi:N-acyl-D-amino-acid deacylase
MHDLVIRGGTIIDGSGAPRYTGDIAIDGETIVAVGTVDAKGRREIDAAGLLVTPGWVDIHTHYDAQVTWDDQLTPSSWHGVTTAVMGSCGVGFAPAAPDRHEWLIALMEGVEDIPGAAMTEGMSWGWESFPEYLDRLSTLHRAIDFAAQIPHGALRAYVMGERGAKNEPATAEDIDRMSALVEEAMRAGALGFSTSRTLLHRSTDGEPVPGTFAAEDELLGLGHALKRAGHGVFQIAAEHLQMPSEVQWMRRIARETGRTVTFPISQTDHAPELWQQMVGILDEIREEGLPVYAQVAGRAIGIIMNLQATAHPFMAAVPYLEHLQLPWPERLALLRDPDVRSRIIAADPLDLGEFPNFVTRSYHKMFRMDRGADYEPRPEDSVAAIAARTGKDPREVAYDLLMGDGDGEGSLYFPLFNYSDQSLDLLHSLHSHPQTIIGLGDAGAHCGAICDGGIPTFMISFWTRDRERGPLLGLEHIIRRQTSATAALFGLNDRGLLKPGYRADINLIDYDAIDIDRPKLAFDLPAGGRRLVQRARGYAMTLCRGTIISEGGEPTGALPGRLVRGPQQASVEQAG